ncbi:hypothetical protein [Spiroplasma taiwanense]|uniref:Lipoprotein n=1 Tax=Spiroplasma taiwanense CT-1 TaxID=1276220 RepID=S5MGB1_9MOLU|nr:hypothetical protein [Spiroplasma taiwanense]AGR40900.1 hypothetical protein STAIW_v1c02290 [Spiroplasma taiwanense CT-1]
MCFYEKILSLISAISLSIFATVQTLFVVGCEKKYSTQIQEILKKDVEGLTGEKYFEQVDTETFSLQLNPNIYENREKLNLIIEESLILYEEVSTYFNSSIS